KVDLLIIDDLGTEFNTVVISSELFHYINTRTANRLHTIISTNLFPDELERRYSERFVSRILGDYELLQFVGDDVRLVRRFRDQSEIPYLSKAKREEMREKQKSPKNPDDKDKYDISKDDEFYF
ncbi:MAG: hypothetical protein FWD01_04555, partial [Defluviitaleaceae bacterium]|nr:hypothetical protein [Defluviitaleaceae bacterium]